MKTRGVEDEDPMKMLHQPQPLDRLRSTSTPTQRKHPQLGSSLTSESQTTPQESYLLAQSLKEGGIAPLTLPLPQYDEEKSPSRQSSEHKLVVQFDEDIVQVIVRMGYSRKKVLMCLVAMAESGQDIVLEDAIEFVVNFEGRNPEEISGKNSGEAEVRRQLAETEEKLKEFQGQLSKMQQLESQKEEEINILKVQIDQLEKVKIEKDTQIEILTGGFGFGTYLKVHGGVDIYDESECVICLENPKTCTTSCGCTVMCQNCYKKLNKKECPNCWKKIK